MDGSTFWETAFPPLLPPLFCWLSGLIAMQGMNRTWKNLLSALSLAATALVMIAALVCRTLIHYVGLPDFSWTRHAVLCAVTLLFTGMLCVFLYGWKLYDRDRLSAPDLVAFCAVWFLLIAGAVLSFCAVWLFTPVPV